MFLFLFICVAYCRRRAGGAISYAPPPLTQCEIELDGGYGRYPREIAAAFPPGVVIYDPKAPGANLFCNCDESAHGRMVCQLNVRRGSIEETLVQKRLMGGVFSNMALEDPELFSFRLHPFFIRYINHPDRGVFIPVILYSHPECTPSLLAEIQVTRSASQMLSRAQSAPGRLNYAWRSMPISQCQEQQGDDTTCPIMLTSFFPGQVVYILQSDVAKADVGNYVQCISAEGLRKLSASNPIRKFRDPLRREGDRMLTIKDDYEAYVLRDDSGQDCERSSSETTNEPSSSSGKAPIRRQLPLPSPSTRIRSSTDYFSFRPGSMVVPGVVRRQNPSTSTSDPFSQASSSSDTRLQLSHHSFNKHFTKTIIIFFILTSIIFLHFCSCCNFKSHDDVYVDFTNL